MVFGGAGDVLPVQEVDRPACAEEHVALRQLIGLRAVDVGTAARAVPNVVCDCVW